MQGVKTIMTYILYQKCYFFLLLAREVDCSLLYRNISRQRDKRKVCVGEENVIACHMTVNKRITTLISRFFAHKNHTELELCGGK